MRSKFVIASIAGLALIGGAPVAAAQSGERQIIDSFTTTDQDLGTIYHVVPTDAGRSMGSSAVSYDPTPEMREKGISTEPTVVGQLLCHAVFAPSKEVWNLEDFRPHVSWVDYIATECNPPVPAAAPAE